MYDNGDYPKADREEFEKQCDKLEQCVPKLQKGELHSSFFCDKLIQEYEHPQGRIQVVLDELSGEVCVESELDLTPYHALLHLKW